MVTDFDSFPCGENCLVDCSVKNRMVDLQRSLVSLPNDRAAKIVRAFLAAYRELWQTSPGAYAPDIALPALFDFVVSAKYAEQMISDGGWIYCAGTDLPSDGSSLYFPFLKTCPRCSARFGKRPAAKSNKPGSDLIGRITGDATMLIFCEVIGWIDQSVRIGMSTIRQGDVDAVIYDRDMVALLEIKSSPLAVYPLEVRLDRQMTEVRDGASVPKRDHSPAAIDITGAEVSLYIPHVDLRIELGVPSVTNWPYSSLEAFVSDTQNVATLISAWKELFDVYTSGWRRGAPKDNRRWLMCGCGGNVDDSKNAPGMERTDDVKKGTYQALKFGVSYKEKCNRRIIRAVLASNFLPLHQFDRYLAELQDVLWTKDKYSVALSGDARDVLAFEASSVFNLYDALLCLTRSIYNDDRLREISSLDRFADELGK